MAHRSPEIDIMPFGSSFLKLSPLLCSPHIHAAISSNSSLDLPLRWLPSDLRVKSKLPSMALQTPYGLDSPLLMCAHVVVLCTSAPVPFPRLDSPPRMSFPPISTCVPFSKTCLNKATYCFLHGLLNCHLGPPSESLFLSVCPTEPGSKTQPSFFCVQLSDDGKTMCCGVLSSGSITPSPWLPI